MVLHFLKRNIPAMPLVSGSIETNPYSMMFATFMYQRDRVGALVLDEDIYQRVFCFLGPDS